MLGVLAVVAAVGLVALVTYLGAREFTRRAADARAAEEARSFAQHSSLLATGDAFNGYLQILRYADDDIVRSPASTLDERRGALQQLLWLNTNRMKSLAIVDRNGRVLATSDPAIKDVSTSDAFKTSRANQGPANSDIILPREGQRGYVEFTAALRDDERRAWGFIYGRAEPQDLWRDTLNATIDGGRNVIINSAGAFATGVPDSMLGTPWRGVPLENGSVRAQIGGNEYICGLGGIGKETQIDYGWNVASCLPTSLIQAEASSALGDQWKVTLAAAILAVVLAGGALRLTMHHSPAAEAASPEPAANEADTSESFGARAVTEAPDAESLAPPDEQPPAGSDGRVDAHDGVAAEPPPTPLIAADVDALALIEAYERRNALLAERMRELIQARIMIAATQADEAYRLSAEDEDRAAAMHRHAIDQLEELRERELRLMAQELHPSIVRLGLPAALRALAKDLARTVDVEMEIDPAADAASSRGGRITIDPQLRLLLYRLVRDAIDARPLDADSQLVTVRLTREADELVLDVALGQGTVFDEGLLDAAKISIEAYGGAFSARGQRVSARVYAPHVEQPEPELPEAAVDSDHGGWDAAEPDDDAAESGSAEMPPVEQVEQGVGDDVEDDVARVDASSAPIVHTFTPPEGPPEVVKENDEQDADEEQSLRVTTFVLEEDEITVAPAPRLEGEAGLGADTHTAPASGDVDAA